MPIPRDPPRFQVQFSLVLRSPPCTRSGIRISTPFIAAAVPVCTLFYFLAVRRTATWLAAVYSFAVLQAR